MEARKAVGYVRVSTQDQVREGVSMDAQEAKIKAYCAVYDFELAGIFSDPGISGSKTENRPGLKKALALCEAGTVLITYSMSRVSRSAIDMLTIADKLRELGSEFVSLSESIDTTTPAGRLFFTIMAALAQFEREQLLARQRMAIDHKRAKNERLGTIPYGYRVADDGKTLLEDLNEQEALALIRDYHGDGFSLRAISKRLAEDGIVARSGNPFAPSTLKTLISACS